jgi:amino-acid N-acetyltransferase
MRPADLRGILAYTSRFQDKLFVLSIDSEVLSGDNSRNVILDISVLRSLGIRIVIVHGASRQAQALADRLGVSLSNKTGIGVTDAGTLEVTRLAAAALSQRILEGLHEAGIRAAVTNAITAHSSGIVAGEDQPWTGRVEKIDTGFIRALLEQGIVPVIPPTGFDGDGHTFRVNSDNAARAVAAALGASKLIFVTDTGGVEGTGSLAAQFSVKEIRLYLDKNKAGLSEELVSKLEHGLEACEAGVKRAHIIDGTKDEALLSEVFSNEGVGTMIYANEYESIRRARKKDVRQVLRIVRKSVQAEEVLPRTEAEVGERLSDFYVFEIDGNIVGCVSVGLLEDDPSMAELGSLFVSEGHENQGIGKRLMDFSEAKARELGASRLIALSTRAFNYFLRKGGFEEALPDDLSPARRARYEAAGRKSKILIRGLR